KAGDCDSARRDDFVSILRVCMVNLAGRIRNTPPFEHREGRGSLIRRNSIRRTKGWASLPARGHRALLRQRDLCSSDLHCGDAGSPDGHKAWLWLLASIERPESWKSIS